MWVKTAISAPIGPVGPVGHGAGAIPYDAPNDQQTYGRKANDWAEIIASTPIRVTWTNAIVITQGDVVERNGSSWVARASYGTTSPAPSMTSKGYWFPFFPTSAIKSVTGKLTHQFTAHRTNKTSVEANLKDFETRLKAANV